MGIGKNIASKNDALGFEPTNKYVCYECAENTPWEHIVADNLQKKHCDYCQEEKESAPVDMLVEKVLNEINSSYDPHGFSETYGEKIFDTEDVLIQLDYWTGCALSIDILESIKERNDDWCAKESLDSDD